jgi:hypothetical protein
VLALILVALSVLGETAQYSSGLKSGESNNDKNLRLVQQVIGGIVKNLDEMKADVSNKALNASAVVNKLVKRGFAEFEESAAVQQLNGVDYGVSDDLTNWIVTELSLDDSYRKRIETMMTIVEHADSQEWIRFEVAFSVGDGGDCRYVVLLARNDKEAKQTQWLIGNVQGKFQLAPNLLIIQEKRSSLFGLLTHYETVVKEVPALITKDDVEVISEFFTVVVFERFAEVLNVLPNQEMSPMIGVDTMDVDPLDLIKKGVNTVINWWPNILADFKSTEKSEIKEKLQQKGFNHFTASTTLDHVENLEAEYVQEYLDLLAEELQIPENKSESFKKHLNLLPHLSKNEFSVYDIAYDTGVGGECKYVAVVYTNNRENQTSSFLVANIKATFEMAPDILVMHETRSIVGGLYSSDNIKYKYQDRPIQEEDVELVFDFFKVAAFKKFADLLNIPVDQPVLPPQAVIQ